MTLKDASPAEVWICEGCGHPHDGTDAPDECQLCQGRYFYNMQDFLEGKDGPDQVHA